MGSFIIEVYAPGILLVILSWVSFWINREATADRISLGNYDLMQPLLFAIILEGIQMKMNDKCVTFSVSTHWKENIHKGIFNLIFAVISCVNDSNCQGIQSSSGLGMKSQFELRNSWPTSFEELIQFTIFCWLPSHFPSYSNFSRNHDHFDNDVFGPWNA